MKKYVFDIETDGLIDAVTTTYCLSYTNGIDDQNHMSSWEGDRMQPCLQGRRWPNAALPCRAEDGLPSSMRELRAPASS